MTHTCRPGQYHHLWFYISLSWLLLCCHLIAYAGENKPAPTPSVPAVAEKSTTTPDKPAPASNTATGAPMAATGNGQRAQPQENAMDGNSHPAAAPEIDSKSQAQAQLENSMDNVKVIEKTLTSLRKEIDGSKKGAVLNRASIKDGLDMITGQLNDSIKALDNMREHISTHDMGIEKLKADLSAMDAKLKQNVSELKHDISTNAADIGSQKYLVENYAAGGYETLLKMAELGTKLEKLSQGQTLQHDSKQNERISMIKDLDRLWLLLAIIMACFLPVAFVAANNKEHNKPLLDGTPAQHGVLLVCLAAFFGYFTLGFGLMFGPSVGGWLGSASFVLMGKANDPALKPVFGFAEYLLYQANFVLLAALVIYTAIGRQLSGMAHLLLALFVGAVLTPLFGHWVGAGHYIANNKGWLETLGFLDAGGASIHMMAAVFALAWHWRLANQKPTLHDPDHPENEPVYCAYALFLLALSMVGLTAGNLSISSNQIATTFLNVWLAGTSGGLVALLHYRYQRIDKGQVTRSLGGFATGLVAVSATAPTLDFLEAIVVGAIAGLLHNLAYLALRKHILRQVWQVRAAYLVGIHGGGGAWGLACVALFGTEGLFFMPSLSQLGLQLTGTACAMVYSVGLANAMFILYIRYKK